MNRWTKCWAHTQASSAWAEGMHLDYCSYKHAVQFTCYHLWSCCTPHIVTKSFSNPWMPAKPRKTKKTKKTSTTKNGSTLFSNSMKFSAQSVYHARSCTTLGWFLGESRHSTLRHAWGWRPGQGVPRRIFCMVRPTRGTSAGTFAVSAGPYKIYHAKAGTKNEPWHVFGTISKNGLENRSSRFEPNPLHRYEIQTEFF